MNPNSCVNLLQLLITCVLKLEWRGKKKSLRKKKGEKNHQKKKILSWAVSILVFGYLCAFVFYFCALIIIITGFLYKKKEKKSGFISLTLFQSKTIENSLEQKSSSRLSRRRFCTFKKRRSFVKVVPLSHPLMKTRINLSVLSDRVSSHHESDPGLKPPARLDTH